MKNPLLIFAIFTLFISCSTWDDKVEQDSRKSIMITNNQSADSITIQSTGDPLKDVLLILDTIQVGYYNVKPLSLCYGQSNEIVIDTSDYGEVTKFKTDTSAVISEFYMDTHDYTFYEYNKDGMIKEYRLEAGVRSDMFHQTKYFYSDKRLDSISTINQAEYYSEVINGKEGEMKNDGIYKIQIIYTGENEMAGLEVHESEKNKITVYNTAFSK